MRARLIDVAARAGVAPNAASTILNNRPDSWASQETRDHSREHEQAAAAAEVTIQAAMRS